jgi:hypothetical protein
MEMANRLKYCINFPLELNRIRNLPGTLFARHCGFVTVRFCRRGVRIARDAAGQLGADALGRSVTNVA